MGADLVIFIVIGPQVLLNSKRYEAIAVAQKSIECFRPNMENSDSLDSDIDSYWERVSDPNAGPISAEAFVDIFYSMWNNQEGRDVMSRMIEMYDEYGNRFERIILVAGNQTWGDEPDGYGYSCLALASMLGLFPVFKIR
jgi:hypothetical protein